MILASARIPPELFEKILDHVGSGFRTRLAGDSRIELEDRETTSSSPIDNEGIGACSLVCRHWANVCRRYMFQGAELKIDSPSKMDVFVKYATRGCRSLVKVHTLIGRLLVYQTYSNSLSFSHRLGALRSTIGKEIELRLYISGPIPRKFPSQLLDTPHWGLSPTAVTPPSISPYSAISIETIHLPSFAHVVKYIEHFEEARTFSFRGLTWDVDGEPQHQVRIHRLRRRPRKRNVQGRLDVHAMECTNSVGLCLQVLASHPCSLFHRIHDDEREALISLLTWFCQAFVNKITYRAMCHAFTTNRTFNKYKCLGLTVYMALTTLLSSFAKPRTRRFVNCGSYARY